MTCFRQAFMPKKYLDPVEYAIILQRVFFAVLGVSFILIVLLMVIFDPTVSTFYIYAFLILLYLFLFSGISLLSFWWFFSIKKSILSPGQINQLIGQSLISSIVLVTLVVMHQTKQLNIYSGGVLLLSYGLYQLWVNSESKD